MFQFLFTVPFMTTALSPVAMSQFDTLSKDIQQSLIAMENQNGLVGEFTKEVVVFLKKNTTPLEQDQSLKLVKLVGDRDASGLILWLDKVRPSRKVRAPPSSGAGVVKRSNVSFPTFLPVRANVAPKPDIGSASPKVALYQGIDLTSKPELKKPADENKAEESPSWKGRIGLAYKEVVRVVITSAIGLCSTVQNWFDPVGTDGTGKKFLDNPFVRWGLVLFGILLFSFIAAPGMMGGQVLVAKHSFSMGFAYLVTPLVSTWNYRVGSAVKPGLGPNAAQTTVEQHQEAVENMSDDLASARLGITRGFWTDKDAEMLARHEKAIGELVGMYGAVVKGVEREKGVQLGIMKPRPLRFTTGLGCVGRQRLSLPAMADGRIAALADRVDTWDPRVRELTDHKARLENLTAEVHQLRAALQSKRVEDNLFRLAYQTQLKKNADLNALNGLLFVLVGTVLTTGVIVAVVPGTYAALTTAFSFASVRAYIDTLVPVALYGWLHWNAGASSM